MSEAKASGLAAAKKAEEQREELRAQDEEITFLRGRLAEAEQAAARLHEDLAAALEVSRNRFSPPFGRFFSSFFGLWLFCVAAAAAVCGGCGGGLG